MRLQATTMAFAMQNPLLTLAETAMVCEWPNTRPEQRHVLQGVPFWTRSFVKESLNYLSIDRSIESNLYNLILSYLIYLSILYMIHIYIIFNVIIHNSNPSTFIHFLALHYPPSHPRATDFLCFWRSHRIQQSWALPEGNHSGHPLEQCSKSRSFHEIPTG